MPHVYTKDQLVEQPTIELFAELGGTTMSGFKEVLSANGTLARETTGEVVLESRLRAALVKLDTIAATERRAPGLDLTFFQRIVARPDPRG